MRHHFKCLSYVARHKWFVLKAGIGLDVPLWRLLIHDWSKFLPSEWIPYANYFCRDDNTTGGSYRPEDGTDDFSRAWLKHIHRQPHHHQHWVLREDSGSVFALKMPAHFVREMVADWIGAGLAQGYPVSDLPRWWKANKGKMVLHPDTLAMVESLIVSATMNEAAEGEPKC